MSNTNENEKGKHSIWYVYKITFPNGKIYVGQAYSYISQIVPWLYIGSSRNPELKKDSIEWLKMATPDKPGKPGKPGKLIQEILFSSDSCTRKELRKKEQECIKELKATDSKIGYNLRT